VPGEPNGAGCCRRVRQQPRQQGRQPLTGPRWGDPRRQGDIWAAHNPYDLADRLRNVRLFVSVGDGQVGPLDRAATNGQLQQIEQALYPQNVAFVERLHQLDIPVEFDAYGPGTHNWPYWERALHRSLPLLLNSLY
jgi:diacylglycerol O-acyltransferase / trehalose O-mycolyltransferase